MLSGAGVLTRRLLPLCLLYPLCDGFASGSAARARAIPAFALPHPPGDCEGFRVQGMRVSPRTQQQVGAHFPGTRSHSHVQSNLHPTSTPDSTQAHPAGSARSVVDTVSVSHSDDWMGNVDPARYTNEDASLPPDAAAVAAKGAAARIARSERETMAALALAPVRI